ncbi:hypothetical protein [Geminocystis sp. GBBB08]|uniref:hypothetical protein n=1 Tax=Geminocystis sp. GBBB08 TaxID=2604140 RepID=UPI0027E2A6F3|nr:hypothetical protein [Geminocystis sp. GBBB08]MBL1209390.1 hypothetical protein [Geminocystis sp. GBBB08]
MNKTTSDNSFDDEELVGFLKTYYPNTPPETKSCEEFIFKVIANESSEPQKTSIKLIQKSLFFSGTLITTLLIIGSYFFNINLKPATQMASETENLETFLVNSWYGSMAQDPESHTANINGEF